MQKTTKNNHIPLRAYCHYLLPLIVFVAKISMVSFHPSPWIFSDEHSYFSMANTISELDFSLIRTSHMPGYSIFLAPAFLFGRIDSAYLACLVFNSLISTSIYYIAYAVFRTGFKIPSKKAVCFSSIIMLCPTAWVYNYVLMSENVASILFVLIFLTALLIYREETTGKWVLFGAFVGFLPIIKYQNIVFLVIFAAVSIFCIIGNFRVYSRRNLLISIMSAGAVFFAFRYIVFPNIYSYPDLQNYYSESIPLLFRDFIYVKLFIKVCFTEIASVILSTGFFPVLFILYYCIEYMRTNGLTFWRKQGFSKQSFFWGSIFVLMFFATLGVTIIHVYTVSSWQQDVITYTRYIDFFQPVIVATGLRLMYRYSVEELHHRKLYIVLSIALAVFIFLFLNYSNIGLANTLSIYSLHFITPAIFALILGVCVVSSIIVPSKALVYLLAVLNISFIVPSLITQFNASNDMKNVFSIGYYFKNHAFNSIVMLDEDIMKVNKNENEQSYMINSFIFKSDDKEIYDGAYAISSNASIDPNLFYSTVFWTLKYNSFERHRMQNSDNADYIITNKALPGEYILNNGGVILYKNTNHRSFSFSKELLNMTATGLSSLEETHIWAVHDTIVVPSYIRDVGRCKIRINLRGLWPAYLPKKVELHLNDKIIGPVESTANTFEFEADMQGDAIEYIILKTNKWDPETSQHTKGSKGLGLDIVSIDFECLD